MFVGMIRTYINILKMFAVNSGDYVQAVCDRNLAENISRVLYPNDNVCIILSVRIHVDRSFQKHELSSQGLFGFHKYVHFKLSVF